MPTSSPLTRTCTCFGEPPSDRRRPRDAIKSLRARKAWLEKQLAPQKIDDCECDALIRERFPRVSWSITEARQTVWSRSAGTSCTS